MNHITPAHLVGFTAELRKEADAGKLNLLRRVGTFGAKHLGGRYGRQLGVGALAGGATGAGLDDDNRVRGAIRGAVAGAGLASGRILATGAGRAAAAKGLTRMGKRLQYQTTGTGLGMGPTAKLREAQSLGLLKAPGAGASKSALKKYDAHVEGFRKGYDNLPGIVRGAVTRPGDLARSAWRRSDMLGKGFAGLGAVEAGRAAMTPSEEGGPGRAERSLKALGSAAGWMVAPTGLVAGTLTGMGGEKAGRLLGRGVDKTVGAVRSVGGA